MMEGTPGSARYRFDDYVLDIERGVLLRGDAEIPLRPQSFEVLVYLVENEGRLVTREELLRVAWPGKVVTDASITQCLVDIRAALDDTQHEKIRTLTRRGYRFELPVVSEGGEVPAGETAEAEPRTRRRHSRRWALGAVVVLMALGAWWWLGSRIPAPSTAPDAMSAVATVIAALPLENLTPDNQPDGFVIGFHDVLLAELGRHPEIRLIGRWSIEALGDKIRRPETLRKSLGADLVLTGNVARDRENVRFTFQLQDTATGEQAWAESYTEALNSTGLIALQEIVAEHIAHEAIRAVTGTSRVGDNEKEPTPAFQPTGSLDAYEHYLNGLVHTRRIEAGEHSLEILDAGRREFEAAMAADPEWAPPYAALGRMLHFLASTNTLPEAWRESRRLIDKALALDPDYGPALVSLGYLEYHWGRDYAAAERAYREAHANGAPNADWGLALLYTTLGRMDDALAHYRAAIASDPLNPSIRQQYGRNLGCDEQWIRAVSTLQDIAEGADLPYLHLDLAYFEVMAGQVESGRARWGRYREAHPEWDGFMHLALGDREAAFAALERMEAVEPLPPPGTALLALQLGEETRALDWLEQRAAADPDSLWHVLCEKSMRALEGNPRFDRILVQLGIR